MSNRSEEDLGAKILDILYEGAARNLRAVVVDDPVRNPETANNRTEELDCLLCCDLPHCFHFWPLCELVDCNVQVLKAPNNTGERAQYVKPPDRQRPGERNGLKGLSWLMKLL